MPNTWKASLRRLLNQQTLEAGRLPRVAIVGIGNQLRSDDAAGLLVTRSLLSEAWAADGDHVLVLEAGHAPENSTAELRRFAPDIVLLIDAAEMGTSPGSIRWIPEEAIDGMSASTHSLPLSMLARYLRLELNSSVMLLGIQPASIEVGETISVEVSQAVDEMVQGLAASLHTVTLSNI